MTLDEFLMRMQRNRIVKMLLRISVVQSLIHLARKLTARFLIHFVSEVKSESAPSRADDIFLFAMIRNEEHQLPSFLEHYRKIGVNRFYFIDNNSTDQTLALLSKESDVVLFQTNLRLRLIWLAMNALLEKYASNRWAVISDADERFVYPHYEKNDLHKLTSYLDMSGATALMSNWIDMYANCEISKAVPSGSAPMSELFCYFDRNELKIPASRRVFNLPKPMRKVSLIKSSKNSYVTRGAHQAKNVTPSQTSGVVMHFAMNAHLKERSEEAVIKKQYFNRSKKYERYLEVLSQKDLNIFFDGSEKFSGSKKFLDLGFMKSEPMWDQLCL